MIDLHLHTTASDGTLSPSALLEAARAAGLTVISITDHDTTAGADAARDAALSAAVELIPGIEISAVANGRDVHVLGYFIDTTWPPLRTFLERQRKDRIRRVGEIRDRLAALGCPIDVAPVLEAAARGRSVGRPQIATALVQAGHVRTRNEAFDRFLRSGRPAYVPRCGPSPEDVIAILHEAGGVASLAHPGLAGRDDQIPAFAAAGLDALEARHSDQNQATEERYRALADDLGLLVTGGSDFHGDAGHRVSVLGTVTLPLADFERLRAAAERRRPS